MTAARARMSDEEFRAMPDAKIGRLHNPIEFSSYARRHETIVLALVLAKPDDPGAVSWWASIDGDPENVKTFPKSIIKIVHKECDGLFVVATMKGYVALERHLIQARIPGLAKSAKWTDEQRVAWKALRARLQQIKQEIADEHKPYRFRKRRRA